MYQRYIEKKNKGAVSLKVIDGETNLVSKQFDPKTGAETEEQNVPVSVLHLQAEKTILLNEIKNIDALIADIQAVK